MLVLSKLVIRPALRRAGLSTVGYAEVRINGWLHVSLSMQDRFRDAIGGPIRPYQVCVCVRVCACV